MHFAASNLTKSHMVTVFTITAMVESNHTNEPGICFLIRFGRTDLIYAFGTDYAFIFRYYQHEAKTLNQIYFF
jgi:hypothetical protein